MPRERREGFKNGTIKEFNTGIDMQSSRVSVIAVTVTE